MFLSATAAAQWPTTGTQESCCRAQRPSADNTVDSCSVGHTAKRQLCPTSSRTQLAKGTASGIFLSSVKTWRTAAPKVSHQRFSMSWDRGSLITASCSLSQEDSTGRNLGEHVLVGSRFLRLCQRNHSKTIDTITARPKDEPGSGRSFLLMVT